MAAAEGVHDQACQHFEDAVDLFERSGAPFETARARIGLASALAAAARGTAARKEAEVAFEALTTLGAIREAERTGGLLRNLEALHGQTTKMSPSPRLTRRELDVIRLISRGLSDKEVAAHLSLSEHTVHRHVSNILTKLDLPSRTAAVAYAGRHGLL